MKYLTLTLLFCTLLSLSRASCSIKVAVPGQTHCFDEADKTWHEFGSSWRNSECMDCTCEGCCTAYSTPVNFPPDCVKVFDAEQCKYIVHKRDDPSELCPIFGEIGK